MQQGLRDRCATAGAATEGHRFPKAASEQVGEVSLAESPMSLPPSSEELMPWGMPALPVSSESPSNAPAAAAHSLPLLFLPLPAALTAPPTVCCSRCRRRCLSTTRAAAPSMLSRPLRRSACSTAPTSATTSATALEPPTISATHGAPIRSHPSRLRSSPSIRVGRRPSDNTRARRTAAKATASAKLPVSAGIAARVARSWRRLTHSVPGEATAPSERATIALLLTVASVTGGRSSSAARRPMQRRTAETQGAGTPLPAPAQPPPPPPRATA